MISENSRNTESIIGSVNCSSLEQTAGTLVNLVTTMGMTNPITPVNQASKAISIKKKGKTYTITIGLFTPPLTFTWTGLFPHGEFMTKLGQVIEDNRKISYINTISNGTGKKFMQFGLAVS